MRGPVVGNRRSIRLMAAASCLALAAGWLTGGSAAAGRTPSAERTPSTGAWAPTDEGSAVDFAVKSGQATVGSAVVTSVEGPPATCDPTFRPASTILFNDPSGSRSAQLRLVNDLVKTVDCTPPTNPDGSQASIKLSFYSLSVAPLGRALVAAARRGVAVQVLANSHADRLRAWGELVEKLGSDTSADSFAVTCWSGCLTPRQRPVPDGPTAWFTARATSADSLTVAFTDLSRGGGAPITSWSWDFGNGTHATGPGPHVTTYAAEGMYPTSLTVRDAVGMTHRVGGNVTVPDSLEPMYPALHAKVFLFSTVAAGRSVRRWVSAFSSANPTYLQAREGFNNLNVRVGDRELYRVFDRYFGDLVAGSQGTLLSPDYYRSASITGDPASGSSPAVVHFLPRRSGDVQLDIVRSIQCRYTLDGKTRRTKVRISMFAFSRIEIAAELWRLAFERGCSVELVYTTMTQRLRGADGAWIRDDTGMILPWGPADCLSTPPTRAIANPLGKGSPGARVEVANTVDGPAGLCAGGTLDGRVAGAKAGVWVDRVSPISKGRLTVTAACPVVPFFDRILRVWAFACKGPGVFTHQKVMLVDGVVRGKVQKYVLTGSANWSETGLLNNDEVVVELLEAPRIYRAYLKAYQHQKDVFARAAGSVAARR